MRMRSRLGPVVVVKVARVRSVTPAGGDLVDAHHRRGAGHEVAHLRGPRDHRREKQKALGAAVVKLVGDEVLAGLRRVARGGVAGTASGADQQRGAERRERGASKPSNRHWEISPR
jgi:hypothetical protein